MVPIPRPCTITGWPIPCGAPVTRPTRRWPNVRSYQLGHVEHGHPFGWLREPETPKQKLRNKNALHQSGLPRSRESESVFEEDQGSGPIRREARGFPLVETRDARVALDAPTVGPEEPGYIRRTVLRVTPKIIEVRPAEIAKQQCATPTCGQRIARIEPRTPWREDTAFTVWVACFFRGRNIGLKLNLEIGLIICPARHAQRADADTQHGADR